MNSLDIIFTAAAIVATLALVMFVVFLPGLLSQAYNEGYLAGKLAACEKVQK